MEYPLWLEIVKSVALPVVLLIISRQATNALKKRELSTKFVEIALSILTMEPNDENMTLRECATKTLNLHAEIKLPKDSALIRLERAEKILSKRREEFLERLERALSDR